MSATYGVMAIIAALLLLGYCVLVKRKDVWLFLMFVCIAVVNTGYFLMSVSNDLTFAIIANDIAYLGNIFLSMCMLFTIVKLSGFKVKKGAVITLGILGAVMFGIVATSGILPWYYKDVTLEFVDGAAKLNKEYGVLHPAYLIYLVSYFLSMIICIVYSFKKKMIASQKYAALVAAIVFGNIAVWFVEKFIPWEFEFLSVSYLFSELVFLGLHWMMQDYIRSDLVPKAEPALKSPAPIDIAMMPLEEKITKVLSTLSYGEMLTSREREILELVLKNKRRKEIAEELRLSENTIKTYTRTLYSKLGVNSREELYALLVK